MASCTKKICKILRMGLEIILFFTYFVHVLYTFFTLHIKLPYIFIPKRTLLQYFLISFFFKGEQYLLALPFIHVLSGHDGGGCIYHTRAARLTT